MVEKVLFWTRGPNGETDASSFKDQYMQSWDVGVEPSYSVEFKWDNEAGQYVPIGPLESEKRRRWQQKRDKIDQAIASGRNPWRD
jgi:hypothetical protein